MCCCVKHWHDGKFCLISQNVEKKGHVCLCLFHFQKFIRICNTCLDAGVIQVVSVNPLTPKDTYSGRTAPLTSKRCILYIYSTNTGTEYFKYGIYYPFFLFNMQFVS